MSEHKLRISAKGFFYNEEGKILLIMGQGSDTTHTYWATPGGGVEENENLISAVERELTEETGYEGKANGIVFIQDYINPKSGRRSLEIFFQGEITSKEQLPNIEPDHKCKFFTEEEFQNIDFRPNKVNPFKLKSEINYTSSL